MISSCYCLAFSRFRLPCVCLFFFTDPPPTVLSTLSLHDALPICPALAAGNSVVIKPATDTPLSALRLTEILLTADRKSTRLNSSHANISYAVFCLKKKKHTCSRTRCSCPPSRIICTGFCTPYHRP